MMPDHPTVQDAAAYLQERLDGGHFDGVPAQALGRKYAPLGSATLVIRIALADWQDHLVESGGANAGTVWDDFDPACLAKQIIDFYRRVKELDGRAS
jgi:hypothetical protein